MDIESIAVWPDNYLLENFKGASVRNGDRFAILVEIEKRGLTEKLKIKPNTKLFEIINRRPSHIPIAISAVSLLSSFLFMQFNSELWKPFVIIGFFWFFYQACGGSTHKLIITYSNAIVKKTFFNLIPISSKIISLDSHENSGLYFSTSLACSKYRKRVVNLGVTFTFKQVPRRGKTLSFNIYDYNGLNMGRPLKNEKMPFCKSHVYTIIDIIPQNLSKLLLMREIPFFCEHMPSGEPIFDGEQSHFKDDFRSIAYEGFSLKRPLVESPGFKDFCLTFTLPTVLTKDVLELYDHDWLRILLYVQKRCIPPVLQNHDINPINNGDFIFSALNEYPWWNDNIKPKKIKFRLVFCSKKLSLAHKDGSADVKSYSYSEIKTTSASSNELFFTFHLDGYPIHIAYNGSLPFKQFIKLAQAIT